MNELSSLPADPAVAPAEAAPLAAAGGALAWSGPMRAWIAAALAVAVLLVLGGVLVWRTEQRVIHLERELVQRQQDSDVQATEARVLAKQADESARDSGAKVALLEARIAEVAVQRGQLDELIQALASSRDENLLVDVEAAVRLGLQQTAITGSAEPLVAALKQSDERLAKADEPRLEPVRRALARDLDKVKSASIADVPSLASRIDEAERMIDELPMLGAANLRGQLLLNRGMVGVPTPAVASASALRAVHASGVAAGPVALSASAGDGWRALWPAGIGDAWNGWVDRLWDEAKSLVRVTRIDRPEAMLLAPEQAFFVRENLKLRLLNARLALLGRQFDTVQADLQGARATIDRYFDRSARRTVLATDLLKQVAAQARQVGVPRPDDTLAALAAATAVR